MFNFKKKTCILYHLAFLDWLPTHYYLHPIIHFQPLKTHFLTTILPFFAMCFMVLRGFVYTIAAHIYAFRLAFSCILHCIQHHFTLRLAPKRTAFSTKTHCVQRHFALRFVANCSTFSRKWPQMWCKWRFFEINIHFMVFTDQPLFASKQTFARIDFLRQGGCLVDKKGTHNVKFFTEELTEYDRLTS